MNTGYEIPSHHCKRCGKQASPRPTDVISKCRDALKYLIITMKRRGD